MTNKFESLQSGSSKFLDSKWGIAFESPTPFRHFWKYIQIQKTPIGPHRAPNNQEARAKIEMILSNTLNIYSIHNS